MLRNYKGFVGKSEAFCKIYLKNRGHANAVFKFIINLFAIFHIHLANGHGLAKYGKGIICHIFINACLQCFVEDAHQLTGAIIFVNKRAGHRAGPKALHGGFLLYFFKALFKLFVIIVLYNLHGYIGVKGICFGEGEFHGFEVKV